MHYSMDDIPLDSLVLVLERVETALGRLRHAVADSPVTEMFFERMNILEASASSSFGNGSVSPLQIIHLDSGLEPIRYDVLEIQARAALGIRRMLARRKVYSGDWLAITEEATKSATDPLPATDLFSDSSFFEQMLTKWDQTVRTSESFPVALRAAIVIDAWNYYCARPHLSWIGGVAAALLLRSTDCLPHHLAINVGMKSVASDRRNGRNQTSRIVALLQAVERATLFEIKEFKKVEVALAAAQDRLLERRSNSKLPKLLELAVRRPIVSVPTVVKELEITSVGARTLIRHLKLREITGRGRDCLWSLI